MRPQCFHCGKSVRGRVFSAITRRFNEAAVFPLRKDSVGTCAGRAGKGFNEAAVFPLRKEWQHPPAPGKAHGFNEAAVFPLRKALA